MPESNKIEFKKVLFNKIAVMNNEVMIELEKGKLQSAKWQRHKADLLIEVYEDFLKCEKSNRELN